MNNLTITDNRMTFADLRALHTGPAQSVFFIIRKNGMPSIYVAWTPVQNNLVYAFMRIGNKYAVLSVYRDSHLIPPTANAYDTLSALLMANTPAKGLVLHRVVVFDHEAKRLAKWPKE